MNLAHVSLLIGLLSLAPGQTDCLVENQPSIVSSSGSGYGPASGTIYLATRTPGVVVHEYAHHVDIACGAEGQIGAELREAQGISADVPWYGEGHPVSWPAEYFANAARLYFGYSTSHDVTTKAVELVGDWLARGRT